MDVLNKYNKDVNQTMDNVMKKNDYYNGIGYDVKNEDRM